MLRRRRVRQRKLKHGLFAGILSACLLMALMAAANIVVLETDYAHAREEYLTLRQRFAPQEAGQGPAPQALGAPDPAAPNTMTAAERDYPNAADLSHVNPDYVGWIRIAGTNIDYPVVQGQDNEKYLHTSFAGAKSRAGAIFMDSNCLPGFDAAQTILYGHNMKDGTMFADLNRYLDTAFRQEHEEIQLFLPDGEKRRYQIFAVLDNDVNDQAYRVGFEDAQSIAAYFITLGAPTNAQEILTLSTCTHEASSTRRLLVCAAR